ncbi:hypothetical protein KKF45_05100, partial [Patescibacteria group bacterium]|nr:hypothetical protein [Patescibacteria group bacterium]
ETNEEAFMKRGLCVMGAVAVPQRRWSLDSIHHFLTDEIKKEPTFWGTFGMIKQRYQHYMDLGEESAYSLASLWVIGSYFFPLFDAYPYTFFGGDRETGKTKMLSLTQQMAFNAISSGNISTSSVFRLIEGSRTTLLIDEAEKLSSPERGQEFRNILNASYKPGNPVFRSEKTIKEQFIVASFDAYSPKMLANISGLEEVVESRVIPFTLLRTLNRDIADREIDVNEESWQDIRDRLYLLAMLKWKEVKYAYYKTEPVEGISARNWEIWRPIIALAKVVDNTGALETEMVKLGLEKSQEKLLEAVVEAGDSVLVRVLLNVVTSEDYYSVKEIKSRMVDSYGETYNWLNNKWIGRAMKRKGFKDKRRMGTGIEYLLNPAMVASIAKRLGISSEVSGVSEHSNENIDMEV